MPNGPVHDGKSLHWPLSRILDGLDEGLHKAAEAAPEGIASIGVDGWAVDYVRLGPDGKPHGEPFCYRDERTVATKQDADKTLSPEALFARTGAQPLRINTLYQLLADTNTHAPWVCLPEYVLYWLGGRRVAEYTNATHTGLIDPATGDWAEDLFRMLGIPREAAPPVVPAGATLGRVQGPLSRLAAFSDCSLIAPACHDTASAIAGIPTALATGAYIASGTWSLVGTLIPKPITQTEAMEARYTNQGAAGGGFCFHTNVNGMWLIKQCMDGWAAEGRPWSIEELVRQATERKATATINVDAEPLLLDGEMPARINAELTRAGHAVIPDVAGNEPLFARIIFESLAARYASALDQLQQMLGRKLDRIHVLGGGSRNKLLLNLTAQRTGMVVEAGEAESSTIGNFAVQLASAHAAGQRLTTESVRQWAAVLCSASSAKA
jgi:rhamnulokinase